MRFNVIFEVRVFFLLFVLDVLLICGVDCEVILGADVCLALWVSVLRVARVLCDACFNSN